MIDRKDPLKLHSFIYTKLLKKTEITHEFSGHALLNDIKRNIEDSVYVDTDSVKERKDKKC